jgi:molybdopterin-guanine dinucleotide biosynthesis protein
MTTVDLPFFPSILLIAGNGRKTGKTSLALQIIQKFAKDYRIYGLKVTTMYPEELKNHGTKKMSASNFEFLHETGTNPLKDTAKMLNAGAMDAYYVSVEEEMLPKALESLFLQMNTNNLIVCESGSLRNYLRPGLFIYLEDSEKENNKDKNRNIKEKADLVLEAWKFDNNKIVEAITATEGGWQLCLAP